jgi:predicted MPP superfamily phosphohydrolase
MHTHSNRLRLSRRQFLRLSAAAGLGTVLYTFEIEPHWVRVEARELPVAGLPAALSGARMVQISDLHTGPQVSDSYLVECLAKVAALRPDILVFTGDFLTYRHSRGDAQLAQLREVLAHFPQGRLATLGILGNHDYGRAWAEPAVAKRVQAVAERAGVRVLRNECATVLGLDVVGVDDLWSGFADPERALAGRSEDAAIVLCHNPDTLDARPWAGYRGWILSGHTHGGQCKPPFLPPPLLPVKNRRYTAGEIPLDDGRRLYINRGLGHLLQVRFNVRPEITSFTLRPAGSPQP